MHLPSHPLQRGTFSVDNQSGCISSLCHIVTLSPCHPSPVTRHSSRLKVPSIGITSSPCHFSGIWLPALCECNELTGLATSASIFSRPFVPLSILNSKSSCCHLDRRERSPRKEPCAQGISLRSAHRNDNRS